jgi:hypothetical protein
MPSFNDFFDKRVEKKSYEIEELHGVRPCSKCDEDVKGAFWDPIDLVMSWRCSKGHETIFKVS